MQWRVARPRPRRLFCRIQPVVLQMSWIIYTGFPTHAERSIGSPSMACMLTTIDYRRPSFNNYYYITTTLRKVIENLLSASATLSALEYINYVKYRHKSIFSKLYISTVTC